MRISEKQMKSIMKEFKYVITDPEGIHARPAGEFTGFAQSIQCAQLHDQNDSINNIKKKIPLFTVQQG